MEIIGKKGLCCFLRKLMIVCLIISIPVVLFLPFLLKNAKSIMYPMFVIYPNATLLYLLSFQAIKIFKNVEENHPFCEKNVKTLRFAGVISSILSIIWLFDLLFMIFIIHNTYINYIIVLSFLTILFFGIGICCYILSALLYQATLYKEENDLTI